MKPIKLRDMNEATRLTRTGRLSEAMSLIQSVLRGGRADGNTAEANATAGFAVSTPLELSAETQTQTAARKTAASAEASATLSGLPGSLNASLPGLRGFAGRGTPASANVFPSTGEYIAGSFTNEAGTRGYKLYIPSRSDGARPLIVMLHGCTQSADDFAAGTRMNFVAEEHGCFVVYPEQPSAANAQKCWNWFNPGDQQRDRGEPALIAGITRQIMRDHKIDARRVYIAGLSAGGAAAAIMGEAYPELYAAVGVHSGLACGAARDLPSAFAAMSGNGPARAGSRVSTRGQLAPHDVPTIVFHGDRDTTVHPRNGAEVIARAGGDVEVLQRPQAQPGRGKFTRSVRRDAGGRSVLELWEIHGAGHAWSGGSPAGSFTDPTGPDATREMLRFFLDHARRERT
jgi:poly(hydroxyalkanoate) depolymerase family esterase